MVQDEKYYEPSIEDFRVGYEFEMNDTWGGWKKMIITEELLKNPLVSLGSGNDRSPWWWKTRVPFLTKEQIEAEGWQDITLSYQKDQLFVGEKFTSDYYRLSYHLSTHMLLITDCNDDGYFSGECKSVNELRYILKLLKIN